MNTHDIDPEEARRLVAKTTAEMVRETWLRKARDWFQGQTISKPLMADDTYWTPWGLYTVKELTE